ncbi:hypothetical protein ACQR0Z_09960 [Bradyrhizobium sp. HKCCYLS3077]|uniref:hypothetical protein n=1 Tax=unclassified Bradyrhizobium TaxID=2631580 RepID=UPI003EB6D1AF
MWFSDTPSDWLNGADDALSPQAASSNLIGNSQMRAALLRLALQETALRSGVA